MAGFTRFISTRFISATFISTPFVSPGSFFARDWGFKGQIVAGRGRRCGADEGVVGDGRGRGVRTSGGDRSGGEKLRGKHWPLYPGSDGWCRCRGLGSLAKPS